MSAKIIILGKPNVGKSSIFNIIFKKNIAIVDNYSGLTRDLREKTIKLWDKSCGIVDSPGLINNSGDMENEIRRNILEYAKSVDVILLVFDGKSELTSEDFAIIKIVRKLNKKVLTVINKTEGKYLENNKYYLDNIGFGKSILVSASHNQSIDQLKWKIYELIKNLSSTNEKDQNFDKLSVAIVGKTNTGKSTIFNLINKKKISVTGSQPNLTRDSVESNVDLKNLNFKIFDTAGFSKNNTIKVNKLSTEQTLKKIRLCKFILIVLDINDYFEKINSKIINLVFSENRCYIVLVNKIDSLKDFSKKQILEHISELNPQINGAPIIFVSAKDNKGFKNLASTISKQFIAWNKRIKTSVLNHWLCNVMKENPPPLKSGNIVKLKYISQVNTSPPKFNIFSNYPNSLNAQYKRYIANNLKKNFDLNGLPVKILFKRSSNPYENS